jgi:hypothetical protein
MVRVGGETLNTFDDLIDVFEDWDSQLRAANGDEIAELLGENQQEDGGSCAAMQHERAPEGLS